MDAASNPPPNAESLPQIAKPNLRALKARFEYIVGQPECLEVICSNIANGGSLIELCKTWDVRYGDILNWLRGDTARQKRWMGAMSDRGEWEKERILQEVRAISTVDIREAFDDEGNLLPIKKMPAHVAAALAAIEIDELYEGRGDQRENVGQTKKIKLLDRLTALKMLGGEAAGMFKQRMDVKVTHTLEDIVAASHESPRSVAPPASPPAIDTTAEKA